MKKGYEALGIMLAIAGLMIGAPRGRSQEPVPVHMVVTAEAHRGPDVPEIRKEDVQVYQGRERRQVADWTPLRGERGALQLFILLDDSSHTNVATQFGEIKSFIEATSNCIVLMLSMSACCSWLACRKISAKLNQLRG